MAYVGGQIPGVMINLSQPIPAGNVSRQKASACEERELQSHTSHVIIKQALPRMNLQAGHHLPVFPRAAAGVQEPVHQLACGALAHGRCRIYRSSRGVVRLAPYAFPYCAT
jgi:hypothetical protein